jgi:hypothetical protein
MYGPSVVNVFGTVCTVVHVLVYSSYIYIGTTAVELELHVVPIDRTRTEKK